MKHFKARIKEKGKANILTPEFIGSDSTTVQKLEKFWGVHEADIEWYEIIEIKD